MSRADPPRSVQEILQAALQASPDARRRLLEVTAADDPELCAEVEALLAATAATEPLGNDVPDEGEDVPERLGPYRLLERLGEGGFGWVYLAEQREPVQRRVAVKLLKNGLVGRDTRARFEAEQQALALMDHPGIARVLDAGVTDDGRPWFAMELIRGEPITTYCRAAGLDLGQRLRLMISLCGAVQHAHHKGVIHRDLKPSNVLVRLEDDRPQCVVIDFGIAKAMHQPLTDRTLFTAQRQLMGTPGYMSPEQASMRPIDIDTRTDVYALGALLYELIAGVRAFDDTEARSLGLVELVRRICEEDPEVPSARLRAAGDPHWPVSPDELVGDLDNITLRCLAKERDRRYATPSALAEELQRFLSHEPVLATTPSLLYRLGKSYRRHRAAFVARVLLAGSLVAAVVVLSLSAGVADRMRERAERSAESAQARADELAEVVRFQAEQFQRVDVGALAGVLTEALREAAAPDDTDDDGPTVTERRAALDALLADVSATGLVVRVLDAAFLGDSAEALAERFADRPAVRAQLQQSLVLTLRDVGLVDRALELQRECLATCEALGGAQDGRTLAARRVLAELLLQVGRPRDARQEFERVLADRGPGDDTTRAALRLAVARCAVASDELSDAAELLAALHARHSAAGDTLGALEVRSHQSELALRQGDLVRATTLVEEAMPALQQELPDDDPRLIESLLRQADVALAIGRHRQGEPLVREALARTRELFGDRHQLTLEATIRLAQVLCISGRGREARQLVTDLLDWLVPRYGPRHTWTVEARMWHAMALLSGDRAGHPTDQQFEQLIADLRTAFAPDDWRVGVTLRMAGYRERMLNENPRALKHYVASWDLLRRTRGSAHHQTLDSLRAILTLRQAVGDPVRAAPLAYEILRWAPRTLAGGDFPLEELAVLARNLLGRLSVHPVADPETGFAKAHAIALIETGLGQTGVEQVGGLTELADDVLGAEHGLTAQLRSLLGEHLTAVGRLDEARAHLFDAYAALEARRGAGVDGTALFHAADRIVSWLEATDATDDEQQGWRDTARRWDAER